MVAAGAAMRRDRCWRRYNMAPCPAPRGGRARGPGGSMTTERVQLNEALRKLFGEVADRSKPGAIEQRVQVSYHR